MAMEDVGRPTEDTEEILRQGYRLEAQSRELIGRIDEVLKRGNSNGLAPRRTIDLDAEADADQPSRRSR